MIITEMARTFRAVASLYLLATLLQTSSVDTRPVIIVGSRETGSPKDVVLVKRAVSISSGGGSTYDLPKQLAAAKHGNLTKLNESTNRVKIANYMTDKISDGGGDAKIISDRSISVVTQSVLTFVTVFFFGCAIILATFAWKRFSVSPFRYWNTHTTLVAHQSNRFFFCRVPLSYQYSALSQFDADPDEEELNDLEENLHILVEDSSSDGDEDDGRGGRDGGGGKGGGEDEEDEDDDDVFVSASVVDQDAVSDDDLDADVWTSGGPRVGRKGRIGHALRT